MAGEMWINTYFSASKPNLIARSNQTVSCITYIFLLTFTIPALKLGTCVPVENVAFPIRCPCGWAAAATVAQLHQVSLPLWIWHKCSQNPSYNLKQFLKALTWLLKRQRLTRRQTLWFKK